MSESRLAVGVVVGAHGVRGGLRLKMFDTETNLPEGIPIRLQHPEGHRDVAVVSFARVPGSPKARLVVEGIDTRDRADGLRGAEVLVSRDALPALAEDEFYLEDAIGLPVVRDAAQPSGLGTVIGVVSNGPQDLLEVACTVRGRRKTWLLPVVPGFVVDVDGVRVLVDVPDDFLPSGFVEQSRPASGVGPQERDDG